jgi:hypothetical protein
MTKLTGRINVNKTICDASLRKRNVAMAAVDLQLGAP